MESVHFECFCFGCWFVLCLCCVGQALGPDLCKQFVGVQLEAFCEDQGSVLCPPLNHVSLKRPKTIRHRHRASTNTSDISIGFPCWSWCRWTYPLCISCRCFDGFNQLKKIVQTHLMGFTRGDDMSCTLVLELFWPDWPKKLMVGKLNMIKSVVFFSTQFFIQSPESFSLKDTWFFQIVFHCFTLPQEYPIPY